MNTITEPVNGADQGDPQAWLEQAWACAFADPAACRRAAQRALEATEEGGEAASWAFWLQALSDHLQQDDGAARAQLAPTRLMFIDQVLPRGQALCAELDGAIALQTGDTVRASLIHRALDGSRHREPQAVDTAFGHWQRALLARRLNQWDLALKHLDAAQEAAALCDNTGLVATVRAEAGSLLMVLGRMDDALSHSEAALAMARHAQAHRLIVQAAATLVMVHEAQGRRAASRDMARHLLDLPLARIPGALARAALWVAHSCTLQGEHDRAEAWLNTAAKAPAWDAEAALGWAWVKGRSLLEQGERRQACDIADKSLQSPEARIAPWHRAQLLWLGHEANLSLGQLQPARQYAERLEALTASFSGVDAGHLALRYRPALASLSCEPQPGAPHCEPAV